MYYTHICHIDVDCRRIDVVMFVKYFNRYNNIYNNKYVLENNIYKIVIIKLIILL